MKDSDIAEHIQRFLRQTTAFEIEAAGAFGAANAPDKIYPVLVAKGISDIVGLKRMPEWTHYACEAAASLVSELLLSGLVASAFAPRAREAIARRWRDTRMFKQIITRNRAGG